MWRVIGNIFIHHRIGKYSNFRGFRENEWENACESYPRNLSKPLDGINFLEIYQKYYSSQAFSPIAFTILGLAYGNARISQISPICVGGSFYENQPISIKSLPNVLHPISLQPRELKPNRATSFGNLSTTKFLFWVLWISLYGGLPLRMIICPQLKIHFEIFMSATF